jgi:hypothetical protein
MTLVTTFVAFWPLWCDLALGARDNRRRFDDSTRLEMRAPVHLADRISSCAILLAGFVVGVLVFVVALPLALSSPFPTPKQREWVIENSAFAEASSLRALMLPQPMEPLPEALSVMAAADPPARQSGPITFAERWSLTVPETAATAAPVANEGSLVDVPAEATRLAPSGKVIEATPLAPLGKAIEVTPPKRPGASNSDAVDRYLWEVYQRKPIKSDSTGDFTWKDPAAAKRMGMSLKAYVINGMDADFREQLYHAGRAMDASGIRWSMLSAFRDDYRQRLAAGFKAHGGNSQHGGSNATGGYGHGRAIDITSAAGDSSAIWHWIDAHGAKFGLRRPMPSADPAHVQPRNTFHDLAHQLREARLKRENELSGAATAAAGKTKIVAQVDQNEGRRAGR